jgi:predicted enzyme related to lactoylglutathione lyase
LARLSYVNVFTRDLEALPAFYMSVFGFPEVEAIRSPIFRGVDAGGTCIGFNAGEAYGLLGLADEAETRGVAFLLNFDVASQAEVEALVPVAEAAGARVIKPPYRTYYDWYQAVLRDPEGNVFRINTVL